MIIIRHTYVIKKVEIMPKTLKGLILETIVTAKIVAENIVCALYKYHNKVRLHFFVKYIQFEIMLCIAFMLKSTNLRLFDTAFVCRHTN